MEFDETLSVGVLLSSAGLARGGLETIAVQFARGLARRGHDVSIVSRLLARPLVAGRLEPASRALVSSTLHVPLNLPVWGRLAERLRPGLALKSQSRSFYRACRLHPGTGKLIPGFDVTLTLLEGETVRFSAWREQHGRPNVSYFPGVIDSNELRRDSSRVRIAISRTVAEHTRDALGLPIDGVIRPGLSGAWSSGEYRVRPDG